MLINFPNQLTSEEEQLLKKIAKMKKKKKLFVEKKSEKDSQSESQTCSAAVTSAALKRTNKGTPNVKQQVDAKEAAKKLIQSGVIKLETENKEKGFKRSCSRKDDIRRNSSLNINQDMAFDTNKATYSSVNSPLSAKSPPFSPGQSFFGANKYSDSPNNQQYSRSSSFNQNNFRKNQSFQNNQTPNSFFENNQRGNNNNKRFNNQNNFQYNQQQQNQSGISLYIKANNVNEELLRSIFNANVSNAKLISIDVKNNFAFVTVDSKEAAENAIQELNGKTFQDSLFSVSLARPRKTFNRNNTYNNSNFERSNNFNNNTNQDLNSHMTANSSRNLNTSNALNNETQQSSNAQRQVINYEDI